MKLKERLLQGTLIKRYKRFFADIKYKNTIITAYCPNPGSMMGLLDKNNKVWFSLSNNPNRKLKYTLEMIEIEKIDWDIMIEFMELRNSDKPVEEIN